MCDNYIGKTTEADCFNELDMVRIHTRQKRRKVLVVFARATD